MERESLLKMSDSMNGSLDMQKFREILWSSTMSRLWISSTKRVQKSYNEIFIGKAGQKKRNCVLNKDSHFKMFHTTSELP